MANINKLEIVKANADKNIVTIKKGFLGMGGKVIDNKSGQPMTVNVEEFDSTEGELLSRVINMDTEGMVQALADRKPRPAGLGNFRLETLLTEDGNLLLMQMFKFVDFKHRPFSDLKVIKGEHAKEIAQLLGGR